MDNKIDIGQLVEFLQSLEGDTERMNHIKHYPHLDYLHRCTRRMLELSFVCRAMLDHEEIFHGDVGNENIVKLKKLLNQL